ncbi:MAG: haloacid dehalogenase-like hydrolase, partial [Litoreibacter sp.]|nr:haloacid dehalogenase-like hydrolase [Litoreibacter sp.]
MGDFFRITPDKLDATLNAVVPTLLLVDFDETLWLRNSTEEFLGRARPAFLAAALLRALDFLRPWRVFFGRRRARHFRDWLRVLSVMILMPWSYLNWRRIAPRIAPEYANEKLQALIREHGAERVVVVSNGFRPLITPLLNGLELKNATLIAAPITHGGFWRYRGKTRATEGQLAGEALDQAVFITDHEDDAELLRRVGTGVLCV